MKNLPFDFKLESLTAEDDRTWEAVDRLFQQAFPPQERRPLESFKSQLRRSPEAEQKSLIYFWVAKKGDEVGGLIFFELVMATGFAYLWFLAADQRYRSHGLGTLLFQAMREQLEQDAAALKLDFKGVVIEVDHPVTGDPETEQINRRRIHFYEKQGAALLPLDFLAPPFWTSSEHTEVLYKLMVKPALPYRDKLTQPEFIKGAVITILSASQLGYQQPPDSSYLRLALDSVLKKAE